MYFPNEWFFFQINWLNLEHVCSISWWSSVRVGRHVGRECWHAMSTPRQLLSSVGGKETGVIEVNPLASNICVLSFPFLHISCARWNLTARFLHWNVLLVSSYSGWWSYNFFLGRLIYKLIIINVVSKVSSLLPLCWVQILLFLLSFIFYWFYSICTLFYSSF